MDTKPITFGRDLVAAFLEQERLTQASLAQKVNCSESHFSLFLKGKRGLSLRLAKRISDATGVPLASLADDADPSASPVGGSAE